MWDTHISALGGWPTVSDRFLRVLASIYAPRRYRSSVRNFSDVSGKPLLGCDIGCTCQWGCTGLWASSAVPCPLWRRVACHLPSQGLLAPCRAAGGLQPLATQPSGALPSTWHRFCLF